MVTMGQRSDLHPTSMRGGRKFLGSFTFALLMIFALMNATPWVHAVNSLAHPLQPVVLLAFAWFIASMVQREKNEERNPHSAVQLTLAIIILLGLMSAFWFGGSSWTAFVETILLPLLVCVGVLRARTVELLKIGRVLNAVLFAVTTYQLIEYFQIVRIAGFSPGFIKANHYNVALHSEFGLHSFGNSDNASVIYVTALAIALITARTSPTRRTKWFGSLSAITALGAVYITGSRGAYISCLVAIVVALWPNAAATAHSRRGRLVVLTLILVLTGLSVWSLLKIQPIQLQGTSSSVRYGATITGSRITLSSPLLGFGPANVNQVVGDAAQTSSYTAFAESSGSAYNLFINWGIGAGALSMFLMILLTVGAIRTSVRAHRLWAAAPLIAFTVPGVTVGSSLLAVGNYSWSFLFWVTLALAWRPEWVLPATPNSISASAEKVLAE